MAEVKVNAKQKTFDIVGIPFHEPKVSFSCKTVGMAAEKFTTDKLSAQIAKPDGSDEVERNMEITVTARVPNPHEQAYKDAK